MFFLSLPSIFPKLLIRFGLHRMYACAKKYHLSALQEPYLKAERYGSYRHKISIF